MANDGVRDQDAVKWPTIIFVQEMRCPICKQYVEAQYIVRHMNSTLCPDYKGAK